MVDSGKPKHTPGPWIAAQEYICAGSYTIARIFPGSGREEANSRLIAAAPNMLKALEAVKSTLYNSFEPDNQSKAFLLVEAAIDGAVGDGR